MANIEVEIHKVVGELSETSSGRKKLLTCTSWGKYNPKFDIRTWNDDYSSMSKGITLTLEEAEALRDVLNDTDLAKVMEESVAEREAGE